MFEFLRGKRKPDKAPEPGEPARPTARAPEDDPTVMRPGREVGYSAELIPRLQADHQALFKSFDGMVDAFGRRDFERVKAGARQLKSMLQDHLMLENIKLYVYLRQNLSHEAQEYQLVTAFRKEMDGIGREAMAFLDKYQQLAEQPELVDSFESEARRVRQIVHDRMSREEATLYQLYQASY
ncbi:MAG: hemerythrin domain-containing protein [Pseudomonadota bacterium]|nr:hemerythrin domain-containing protein [Pseudomonadota bacterium]